MTDKVQKIREEVERLKGWNNNVRNSTRHMTLQEEDFNRGKHSSYLEILNFIDSLQEEPSIPEIVDEHYWEMLGEEPVSENLEKAAVEAFKKLIDSDKNSFLEIFKAGAQWKEKEMQSTIELAEDHAMLAGMEKMREQMIKDATEAVVAIDSGGYPYIDKTIELYDYDKDIPLAKEGDKYKVVLIKKE